MNKFCWLYVNKVTGEEIVVQRPRRRAINPKIAAYKVPLYPEVFTWYFVLTRAQLRRHYKYVGRRKTAQEILKEET